jgi:hypothetical protein
MSIYAVVSVLVLLLVALPLVSAVVVVRAGPGRAAGGARCWRWSTSA